MPDVIKIDVEGAELRVLAGGAKVLSRLPAVICEVSRENAEAVAEILVGHGYALYNGDQRPGERVALSAAPFNTLAVAAGVVSGGQCDADILAVTFSYRYVLLGNYPPGARWSRPHAGPQPTRRRPRDGSACRRQSCCRRSFCVPLRFDWVGGTLAGRLHRSCGAMCADRVACPRRPGLGPSRARFQPQGGPVIALPGPYTAGAREMYCRNVYLRTGLVMPRSGWVVDLGANHGLFSVWAAMAGAQVVAVEAQQGFAPVIRGLAAHNGVAARVRVETAIAGGVRTPGATAGVLASDRRWATTSHGAAQRPVGVSIPEIISGYRIDRIGLLKVDIEGGEFAVFGASEDLGWLRKVDQLVMEVHPDWGDAAGLADRLREHGYHVELRGNAGNALTARTERFDYAYCRRP